MKFKKLAAVIAAALVLATSAVCLTACGGGSEPTGNDTSVSTQQDVFVLEGTWQITEATAQGVDAMEVARQQGLEDQMTVTFQNGVATVNLMGQITTGNYTYENGVLELEGGIANISGNRIEFNVEGVHLVLEKKGSNAIIGGADEPTGIVVSDNLSLNGTTWKITSMTQDGEEVTDDLSGADVTFTEDQMILSYGGEKEYVDYTLSNGIIDAEGITGTVTDNKITFSQGGQVMVFEKTSGLVVHTPSTNNSAVDSIAGTNWEIIKMTDDGEDVSDQLDDIGGISVRFTEDQMIMTANGLGESEYVDYTYENGVIDAEGITGTISGDTLTFKQGDEEMVMRRR